MARKLTVAQEVADVSMAGETFQPYVADAERVPEFTLKAVMMGTIISVLFGAANAYLGLKAGLTVASSIPASVIAAAFFKFVRKGTPLENNIVQTIGSVGYAMASGIIFTIPAFFIWQLDPGQFKIFIMALIGGLLGVLMMIPLRHFLMVKEHGVLPFPEGTACAEVIISSQETAHKARHLFAGFGFSFIYQLLCHPHFLGFWQATPGFAIPGYAKARFSTEATPELLGAGFIIGPRISAIMFSGGALGALILVPLIAIIGQADPAIAELSAGAIRGKYIRMIGTGAVLAGGLISMLKALPTIFGSLKKGMQGLVSKSQGRSGRRTEWDLSPRIVFGGIIALVAFMALAPEGLLPIGLLGALCVALFGFIFVTVGSRICGLVGSSASPVSGMVIATLLLTAALFVAFGLTSDVTTAKIAILSVGSIVCIAAAKGVDISQDLKTGFLVGATPAKQQIAQLFGVLVAAITMALVVYLFKADILSGELAAPQANLMATVIDAVLRSELPWGLLGVGITIAIIVELLGISSLAFAIGLYLPFNMTATIGIGGALCALVRWQSKKDRAAATEREERGVLMSSGYIAGGTIAGVIVTALVAAAQIWDEPYNFLTWIVDVSSINPDGYEPTWEPFVHGLGTFGSYVIFGLLAFGLYGIARGKKGRTS